MPKTIRWILFQYKGGQPTPLSKTLKSKEQAEKARKKYPEKERRSIAIGMIRLQ
jgi:hypothetical protein